MESVPPPDPFADEYFVLRRGDQVGPLTLEELRAALGDGRLRPRDLVQRGKAPIWHPADVVVGAAAAPASCGAPAWREILTAARARLLSDVRTASWGAAGVFLAVGIAAWLLSRWPVALWLPWFLPPVIAGVLALTAGRLRRGLSLLLAVAVAPAVAMVLRPKAPAPMRITTETLSQPPAPSLPDPPPLPTPADIAVASVPPPAPSPPAETVMAEARQIPPAPPETPAAAKPAAPPPSVAPIAPGDLVQTHRDSFVLVNGDEGHGSGFICRIGGRTLLFTNNHVVAGMRQPRFTLLSGAQIGVGAAESAAGYDVMRLALTAPPEQPLEALENLETQARIGDDVVVLGNTGGGGVVTSLEGRLVGIGPDRLEVTSEFIPGNSGSPIVHVKTGRVIGIATYLTRRYEEFADARSAPGGIVVRRFGYRLDTVKKWEPVNWAAFHGEAMQLRKISQLTGDVFDFLESLREGHTPNFATDTLRRPAMEWVAKTGRSGVSEADRRNATQGFLGALRLMVRADVVAAENELRYTFFREELRQEREIRDRLFKAFDDEVRRMTSPSARAGF